VPPLHDLSRVRSLLDRDRVWSAYAIGDLAPGFVEHCSWYAHGDHDRAVVLLYRGFSPSILFALGAADDLAPLIQELDAPAVSLHLRPEALDAVAGVYTITETHDLWRMAVDRSAFAPVDDGDVEVLGPGDLDPLQALYDEGRRHGDGPTFFQPSMLANGSFRGVRDGDSLIAVAGAHLFSPPLGVCAVGNVYTRRDRRRRGLAARVTSAVVRDAFALGIETVVLNVSQTNDAARRVYEHLGFRCACAFVEGQAVRRVEAGG
jgi:ribosomal protein S18 acetylase RimI-like enzyme